MRVLESYCDRYGYTTNNVANELDYHFFEMDYAEESDDTLSLDDMYGSLNDGNTSADGGPESNE